MESEAAHEVPRHVRCLAKAEETTEQYSSLIGKVFIESKRAFTVMKVGWIEQGKEHEGELVAWYCDVPRRSRAHLRFRRLVLRRQQPPPPVLVFRRQGR